MGNLKTYKSKRNFEKTLEPEAKIKKGGKKLRFAVQHHLASRDHFDFRLEWEGVLLSWAVPKGPSFNVNDKRLAIKVEDHPYDYRNFEGTIPKGEYGGGVVMLWDEGFYEPKTDFNEGLNKGSLKFTLLGKRLKGSWSLIKIADEKADSWLMIKEKDEYAKDSDGISEFSTSIKTGRTMEEIDEGEEKEIKNPFDYAPVELAKLISVPPSSDDYIFEVKYDGYRIVSYIENDSVKLLTRNGQDYTSKFRSLADSLLSFGDGRCMVLDGEVVVIDQKGKTDFQALQNQIKKPLGNRLSYMVFDLLALDGEDIRKKPLTQRKKLLQELFYKPVDNIHFSSHVIGKGKECFEDACRAGMEGIVGKIANSPYLGSRSGNWVKIKCDNRQEFVIGGFTLSDKKSEGISALLLGVYECDKLVYAGRAGTGFKESNALSLAEEFSKISIEISPFSTSIKKGTNERIFWLKPKMVAEIKFAEWTKENQLRQASFKGIRTDKNPKDVVRENKSRLSESEGKVKMEKPDFNEIKITSKDKIIYQNPKTTKGEVIEYYKKVSNLMLPYLKNRLLSIVRCPKGVAGTCFFKKHPNETSKGIVPFSIEKDGKEAEEYFYINNEEGIIYEAQNGTLEFHFWGSTVDNLEKPDFMVFDLDPDEGMDIGKLREGVSDLKEVLDSLGLKSFLKTSGGKGFHIAVPFKPSINWDVFYDFSKKVANLMTGKWPDKYTDNVRKNKRTDKIYIDYLRNGRGSTCVAPYSLRAKEGAKVSMPIRWEDLNKITPNGIDMEKTLTLIKGKNPWEDFFNTEQELN